MLDAWRNSHTLWLSSISYWAVSVQLSPYRAIRNSWFSVWSAVLATLFIYLLKVLFLETLNVNKMNIKESLRQNNISLTVWQVKQTVQKIIKDHTRRKYHLCPWNILPNSNSGQLYTKQIAEEVNEVILHWVYYTVRENQVFHWPEGRLRTVFWTQPKIFSAPLGFIPPPDKHDHPVGHWHLQWAVSAH